MTLLQYTALYFNEILIDKKAVMKFLHFVTALFILLFIGNSRASAFSNFLFAESVKRVCVSTRRQRKLRKPQTLRTANYLCHYDTALVTSTHFSYPEHFSSSGIVSSIALLELPQAGKTVSYLFSDSSR